MISSPLISICIPAYKSVEHLNRLLDSITVQTFKDAEVIITDDSPDNSVEEYIKAYSTIYNIKYFKNLVALGTPENWNEAIRKANGTWIKIMHDDDWFAFPDSLQTFANAALNNPEKSFIFSAYQNVQHPSGKTEPVHFNPLKQIFLNASPYYLFKGNYIGNPSCTLIKRDQDIFYDNQFKWVVDFEFYIRVLNQVKKYVYINETLVCVGISDQQVTKHCFRVAEVEIPENQTMLKKFGFHLLRNPVVYDYYWRLYRNLGIRHPDDVSKYDASPLHPILKHIIFAQSKVSPETLWNGLISKTIMSVNFLKSLSIKTD